MYPLPNQTIILVPKMSRIRNILAAAWDISFTKCPSQDMIFAVPTQCARPQHILVSKTGTVINIGMFWSGNMVDVQNIR